MSSLDKYTHTELVHIVDMFDIDMKMKDLKATKKELLKNLIDKGVHLKFKNSLPTKTEIKKEVEKAKKKPRSKVARVLAGQKKITDSFKKKTEDKKASEQEKQEAKKEATKLRTSLADRFGKQAKAKDQPKDKKATEDEKGEARIGASRLRSKLSARFDIKAEQAEKKKKEEEKKKKEEEEKKKTKPKKVKKEEYKITKSQAEKIATGSIKATRDAGLDRDDVAGKANKPAEIVEEFGADFYDSKIREILEKKNPFNNEFKNLDPSVQSNITTDIYRRQIAPIIIKRNKAKKGKGLGLYK